jgi:hypothetical protein
MVTHSLRLAYLCVMFAVASLAGDVSTPSQRDFSDNRVKIAKARLDAVSIKWVDFRAD